MNSIGDTQCVAQRSLKFILLSLALIALPDCHAKFSFPATREKLGTSEKLYAKVPVGTRIELTLTGYNYTNRYIDQFDVDGQSGGNISVSGPGTAGNGSSCCVSYRSGAGTWKAKIRWQTDACTFQSYTDGKGNKHARIHSFFKEIEVQVDPNIPEFPRYFEVHIYPDGHAEAAITAHESLARLVLSKNREDNSAFSRCPNDEEPK